MSQALESVLKALPAYLSHFCHWLTQPAQLVNAHVKNEDARDRLEQSIAFLLWSLTLALVLAVIFPEMTNPSQHTVEEIGLAADAMVAIKALFELMGLSALAYLAAKLAGVHSGFPRFFGLMCAACGIMLVIQVFASALTNISLVDPVTAKGWIAMEKGMAQLQPLIEQQVLCATHASTGEVQPNPALGIELQRQLSALQSVYLQATDRPLFKLAAGLQLLAMLTLLLWSGRLWLLYLSAHQLSTSRMVWATLMMTVFTGAGMLVYELVNAGSTMMSLYRQCS